MEGACSGPSLKRVWLSWHYLCPERSLCRSGAWFSGVGMAAAPFLCVWGGRLLSVKFSFYFSIPLGITYESIAYRNERLRPEETRRNVLLRVSLWLKKRERQCWLWPGEGCIRSVSYILLAIFARFRNYLSP